MDRNEKANELIARAENAGIRLEFDSGLNVVKRTESGDPDGQRAIIAELWKHLGEVRHLAEGRAIGRRGQQLVGKPIWCEHGHGTLLGESYDGTLTISTSQEMRLAHEEYAHRSQVTLSSNAESLLVIDDGPEAGASSPDGQEAPEQPRPGFLERLRGR